MHDGIEPDYVGYSSLPSREPLAWPEGKPLALSVFLYFEHWDLDPADAVTDPRFREILFGRMPDYATRSWFDYGNRVGIFRILDLLDRLPVKVTVAANSSACERYPRLVAEFLSRNYEFAAHGAYANHMITSQMAPAEERRLVTECLDLVERHSGVRPVGWIGPGYGESTQTPAILAEEGLKYVADWANDEQPYRMEGAGNLLSIPNQSDLDDVEMLYHRRIMPWMYPQIMRRAFERLRDDGRQSGRFLGVHIHPWLFGKPYLTRYLAEALSYICGEDECWHAQLREVAEICGD